MGLFNWQKGKIDDLVRDFLYGVDSDGDDEDADDKLLKVGRPAAKPLLDGLKREKDNQVQMWLDGFLLLERICNQIGDTNLIEEGIDVFSEDMHIQDLLYLEQEGREIIHDFALQELIKVGSSDIGLLISEMVDYIESSRGNYKDYENDPSVICTYSISPDYFNILGKFKSSKVIDQLINWLTDVSLNNWKGIIKALVDIGSQSVMPVINLLFNSNDEIRKRAVIALGKIGDLRAIEPLDKALQTDSSPDVKFKAAEALERIGGPSVNALTKSLYNQDQTVRKYAADALGFIGDKRAFVSLAALLKDQDKEVREKAEKAIHRICQKCNLDYEQTIRKSQIKTIKTIPEEKLNMDKPGDSLETIKKLKELLDMGAITEEEFQMKKNKLMNEI